MIYEKKYILITGATVGIGYELFKLFLNDYDNFILVARNEKNLENIKSKFKDKNIIIKALDLSDDNAVNSLIKFIKENKIELEVLVNNAGIGSFGEFHKIDWKIEEGLINLNIKCLTKLSKELLPIIIKNKNGGILNVASTAGFCAGPKMAVYYASKSYVINFTEAIYEELKDYKIKVSCLCPGPVKTDFQKKSNIKKSDKSKKYLMDSKTVAKIGYEGFKNNKLIVIPGFKNKMLININKFLPRSIGRKIVFNQNKN